MRPKFIPCITQRNEKLRVPKEVGSSNTTLGRFRRVTARPSKAVFYFILFYYFIFYFDTVLLYSPGGSQTLDPPASAS
jgi:hypothetical protein